MSRERRRNTEQARWIVKQGWVSETFATSGAAWLGDRPAPDLCELLLRRGMLTLEQATAARRFAEDALGTRIASSSDDSAASRELGFAYAPPVAPRPSEAVSALPPRSGTELPAELRARFRVEGEVSRGAMGVVLRARERGSGQLVAIKTLIGEASPKLKRRFDREAKALVRLEHPNIVRIFDYAASEARSTIVMELIEGEDMATWSFTEKPWREVAEAFLHIADALRHCHEQGVLHRDIKPANILIEAKTRRPVLIDFGLMKAPSDQSGSSIEALTRTGEVVGTPAFMSPEQFTPNGDFGELDRPTDVWSFGATLHFVLAGRPAFEGVNAVELFRSVVAGQNRPLRADCPEAPAWLEQLIASCLTLDSEQRPTFAELTEELERGLGQSQRRVPVALLGALAALLLAALLLAAQAWTAGELALIQLEAPDITAEAVVVLRGQLTESGVEVRTRGAFAVSDASGRFELRVPINPGVQRLALQGRGQPLKVIEVIRDDAPPVIVFDGERRPGLVIADPDGVISGRVDDLTAVSLTLRDIAVELDETGAFRVPVNLDAGAAELRAQARDAAGLVTEVTITVTTEEAWRAREAPPKPSAGPPRERKPTFARTPSFDEQGRFIGSLEAVLMRRADGDPATLQRLLPVLLTERWRSAAPTTQDNLISELTLRLGDAYTPLPTQIYTCGPVSTRIGRVRHRKTGLTFHLIPGETYSAAMFADPSLHAIIADLEAFGAETAPRRSRLREMLSEPPFPAFIARICPRIDAVTPRTLTRFEEAKAAVEQRLEEAETEADKAAIKERWQRERAELQARYAEELDDLLTWLGADPQRIEAMQRACIELCDELLQRQTIKATRFYVPPRWVCATEVHNAAWVAGGGAAREGPASQPVVGLSLVEARAWVATQQGWALPDVYSWVRVAEADDGQRSFSAFDPSWRRSQVLCEERVEGALSASDASAGWVNGYGLVNVLGNAEEWAEVPREEWSAVYDNGAAATVERLRLYVQRGGVLLGGSASDSAGRCSLDRHRYLRADQSAPMATIRPVIAVFEKP